MDQELRIDKPPTGGVEGDGDPVAVPFSARRTAATVVISLVVLALLVGGAVWLRAWTGSGVPAASTVRPATVAVYAHRGVRSFAPENTMPGYAAGLAIGTDFVDMDVVMTKDREVLVSHDIRLNPDIVRGPDGAFVAERPLVKDLTLQQVLAYDVGRIDPASDYAAYFPSQVGMDGVQMPTMREVIDFVKDRAGDEIGFQVEIKTDPAHPEWTFTPAEIAAAVHGILADEGVVGRTEIQAFDWRCLYELQRLDPSVQTAYLTEWDNEPGTANSFYDPDPVKAGLWTGGVLVADHGGSIPQTVKDMGGTLWEPEDAQLTRETLDEAHRLGLRVVVWTWPEHSGTAFDEGRVATLIDWGVDGIITDDPGRLISMLAARGYGVPAGIG